MGTKGRKNVRKPKQKKGKGKIEGAKSLQSFPAKAKQ